MAALPPSSGDKLDFIGLHLDPAAPQQWGASSRPDEEVMAMEEAALAARKCDGHRPPLHGPDDGHRPPLHGRDDGHRPPLQGAGEPVSFAGMFRLFLVYCFSDAERGGWEMPVRRALAIVQYFFAGDAASRLELGAVMRPVYARPVFGLDEFERLLREEACAERYLRQVLRYVMPRQGKGEALLKDFGRRLFLFAKAWLPQEMSEEHLSRDKVRWVAHELGYEQLAEVFGEIGPGATRQERGRARARWCALKDRLIEHPVRAAGERIHLHFSKSEETRGLYRAAQMGNRNRKGKAGGE